MDFDITITISEHGRDEDAGARFLESFLERHPDTDPVITQNTETGELSIVLTISAPDAEKAFEAARPIFADGATHTGLPATHIVGLHAERSNDDREIVAA